MTTLLSMLYSYRIKLLLLISLFVSPYLLCGQQFLNLDFEKTSIEHPIRPWGWTVSEQNEVEAAMDSLVKYEGDYSFRLENLSKTKGSYIMGFDIEPYALHGKEIVIKGRIKTEQLKGKASVTVSDDMETKEPVTAQITITAQDWVPFTITYQVPNTSVGVSVNISFEGVGTVWFDDICLLMDEVQYKKVPIAKPFTIEQKEWIANHSTALMKTNLIDQDSNFSDLKKFKEAVNDAKIIALGEATHGTSEFFTLKHRVLAYSVKKLGVRIFGLEGNMLTVEKINQYVLTGKGTIKESMRGIFMVWYNEEVYSMIEWVREYNTQHPNDPVQFVGYDIQEIDPPLDSLYVFLEKKSPVLLKSVSEQLSDLKENGNQWFTASEAKKLNWYEKATIAYNLIKAEEDGWMQNVVDAKDRMEIVWGMQYANLIKQFAENAHKGHLSFYRDEAMAENISWFLSNAKSNTRMLIWAHDYHISRAEHPNKDLNIYGGLSMGQHLSKEYGNEYKAFGLSTYQGHFRGMISYSNFKQMNCPLHKGPIGTLDEVLHRLSEKNKSIGMFLDLSNGRSQSWLTAPLPMRFANHVNIEYGYWTRYSIPYQFDGIFFIDTTSAANTLR